MERLRPLVEKHTIMFQSLVHQYKNLGKFIVMRMRHTKEPEFHVITHIQGKNEFVDEKMKTIKENQLLFLIKMGLTAYYLILTED